MREFIARNLAYWALRLTYPALFQGEIASGTVAVVQVVKEEVLPRSPEGPGPHYADLSKLRSIPVVLFHLYAGRRLPRSGRE